ncbi:MAG TPA: alkaline phosphatase family protein [Rudaea sp.]|nr:alkaline phosphatase family protein [Rudaea sp.]
MTDKLRSAAFVAAALFCSAAIPASAYTSGNLLIGGDAEAGKCTTDWKAVTTVPGWTVVLGNPSVVCYSIASFSTPSSAHGNAFIADGPYGDSALLQTVDVSSAASAIDAGSTGYTMSGWLGGWGAYAGQAQVTLSFFDAHEKQLGTSAELGPVTAADRGNKNAFLARSISGTLPAGTRSISVLLQFSNTSASYNIGYADNLSLTLSTPVQAATLAPPASHVPAFDHVFLVMMENTDYAAVIGDTKDASFINGLASSGTLLANSSGTYHPSDENYLAIAGGDNFVQGAIYYPNIHVSAPHLGDRLEAIGKTWKGYEQGMGTPCNLSNNNDSYYAPDDLPFINFTDISTNSARCQAHLVDLSRFAADLNSTATTPNFVWLSADDYYDGEASGNGSPKSLQVQDGWLKQTLQPLFASPAWTTQRSLLILTWDESETSGTNHIATILVDSQGLVNRGYVSQTSYNHYSVGRTIESALGLAPLTANDQYAEPVNDAFLPNAPPPTPSLSTPTPSVAAGATIAFDYSTPASDASSTNWIGIYPAGATPGSQASITWQYAANMSGTLNFATSSLAAGSYAAWYCYNDGYTVLAGPVNFTITP